MERGRFVVFSLISAACIVAAVLIAMVCMNVFADTPEVHLPEQTIGVDSDVSGGSDGSGSENVLQFAELRPDTVQYVLEIIEKPKSYSCNYTVENFWNGGSGSFDVSVYTVDDISSVSILCDQYMKRVVFTPDDYYIWYADELRYYRGQRGSALESKGLSDALQMSGSYQTLMELDSSSILEAAYVETDGTYCIYAKAAVGELGYISEYYIYPDTGILLKNEVYDGDTLIYRMSSRDVMLSVPYDEYYFTLPGGQSIS